MVTKQALQHYINHISLVVDCSGSMQGQPVVTVFDKELNHLKQRSVELNQETRISIYLFNGTVQCLTFDMDVMRFNTLAGFWQASGSTAMLDAIQQSIQDHQKLPELYGDHAYLTYIITDGEENASKKATPSSIKALLNSLPEHWTTACLVPDATGVHEAKKFGLSQDSISIWDTTSKVGLEKVGQQFSSAVEQYMQMRATGVRGTKTFFATLDTSKLKAAQMQEAKGQFEVFQVKSDIPIKDAVEQYTGRGYVLGAAYYQPVKKVKIQDHKDILVQDVHSGKVYTGSNIRQLLGLPASTAMVDPGQHKNWRVFVQSTSVNRKLFTDTHVLLKVA